MPSLGGGNPFSHQLGGGPSRVDQVNKALKGAVGDGGSAIDGTLEAEWRRAKARGWASSLSDERAMYQTWPDTCDEGGLEVFERLLGIVPPGDTSIEARRQVATVQWVKISSSSTPDLTNDLALIDPSIVIINLENRDTVTTTVPGRAFQDADPLALEANGPVFFPVSGQKNTLYPNASQDFILFVSFPNPPGPLPKSQLAKLFQVADLLDLALPAWCQFQISTKIDPTGCFILDVDALDITGVCS